MLLAPLALALLVLAVPIILMYVLKLRRKKHVVPSTFLWRQALEDVQANAPWQRLRFNILLLLQLLALAAVVLALARPAYSRSHTVAGDLVVVVDESYGMQAHDVFPSRFSVALGRARTLASELGGSGVMSVIGMGAQPHLVIADSSDESAINRAIDTLRVGVDQPNFLEALSLASSLARTGQDTRVVVLTSRDSGIATLPLTVPFPVDIVRIGKGLHDLGITAFKASESGSAVQAVAQISNFGSGKARSGVELWADGHLADVRSVSVEGNRKQNLFWTYLPSNVQRLQLRLTQADDVSTDKSAWSVIPAPAPRKVLLVARADFFLEKALLDDPSVQLTVLPPSLYTPGSERQYDLAIFDAVLPPTLPLDSALFVAPPSGKVGSLRFRALVPGGPATAAASGMTGPLASLLQYVDLSDVHIALTRSASLPAWLQPIVVSNGRTLLAAGEQGTSRVAVVSFDLQRSDWPLRISFPIMLQNLLHYLAPGLTLGATDVAAGGTISFFPPAQARELQITRPDGVKDTLLPPFPPFTDTARPGLYTVTALGRGGSGSATGSRPFAVNFFPVRSAPVPGPAVLHLGHAGAAKTLTASISVNVGWIFVLLALALLGAEWWVAFRGTRLR